MPARSVCLVTLSLSEAGPGRFGGQVSVTGIYHTIPYHNVCAKAVGLSSQVSVTGIYHTIPYHNVCAKAVGLSSQSVQFSSVQLLSYSVRLVLGHNTPN